MPASFDPTLNGVLVMSTRSKRAKRAELTARAEAYDEPLWLLGLLRHGHKILHYRPNWDCWPKAHLLRRARDLELDNLTHGCLSTEQERSTRVGEDVYNGSQKHRRTQLMTIICKACWWTGPRCRFRESLCLPRRTGSLLCPERYLSQPPDGGPAVLGTVSPC